MSHLTTFIYLFFFKALQFRAPAGIELTATHVLTTRPKLLLTYFLSFSLSLLTRSVSLNFYFVCLFACTHFIWFKKARFQLLKSLIQFIHQLFRSWLSSTQTRARTCSRSSAQPPSRARPPRPRTDTSSTCSSRKSKGKSDRYTNELEDKWTEGHKDRQTDWTDRQKDRQKWRKDLKK